MAGSFTITQLEEKSNTIRKDIISMLEAAGSGHSAGPLGLADIVTALYFDIMNYNPKHPDWDERDIFILSNGHTVPVQYAAMAEAGFFEKEELKTLPQTRFSSAGTP